MYCSRVKKMVVGMILSGLLMAPPADICTKVLAETMDQTETSERTFRSVEENDFIAKVKTVSSWQGHANIEITFTNNGQKTIHDWYFTFDYPYTIENPYNCSITEHKEDLYTIANKDWNQDILPGRSQTVGFTVSSKNGNDITEEPSFYLLNTKTITLDEDDLSYRYEEYSDWTSGFNGALILKNRSNRDIRDWTITFNSNRQLTQADSSVFSANAGGSYTITNDCNNQNISKGQEWRIGIQGGEHDPSVPFAISDYSVSAKTLAIGLEEDRDNNGICDVREADYRGNITVPTMIPTPSAVPTPTSTIAPTATVAPTKTPTATPIVTATPTITDTPSPTATVTPTIEVTPVITVTPTASPVPTADPTPVVTGIPEDIDYETDTDGDLIPDDLESYYGTDKDDPDTDKDGLLDGFELFLELDPLSKDSNSNGKTDDKEDYDKDGLTNKEEQDIGTNPMSEDTDYDKLKDSEEVKLYGTSPLKYDTDEDGISDYNEVRMGINPKVKDSDSLRYQTLSYNVPDDSKLKGVTSVTVRGSISGCIDENTRIKNVYDVDTLSSRIKALVGVPVDIESTGDFGSMTIVFKYSDEVDEENLKVLWYDEENNEYKVLRNSVQDTDENTVSVSTTHFSKYMLIDEAVWVRTWASACDSTNNYYNLFEWGYDMPRYIHSLENKDDTDGDGLPDCIETGGMINNIGEVVRTDPSLADTDGDTVSDGAEMGTLGFVIDAVPNIESSKYNEWIPVSYDIRWSGYVYYKQKSCPDNSDSDGDGADDNDDATSNDKNGSINYILMGKDNPNEFELSIMKNPYIEAFKDKGEEVVFLGIYKGSEFDERMKNTGKDLKSFELFQFALGHLQCDLEKDYISEKPKYSHVDKLIIIAHGQSNWIQCSPQHGDDDVNLLSTDIESTAIHCNIQTVDIQACHCGRPDYFDMGNDNSIYSCVAFEFAKKPQIDVVYAWNNECKFLFGYNFSLQGGIYEKFYLVNKSVIHKTVEARKFFMSMPLYRPLEY